MSRPVIPTMILAIALGGPATVCAQSAEHCFLGATASRYGDGGRIQGSAGTIEPGGLLQMGRRFVVEAGGVASADTVRLGPGSQVAAVAANDLVASKATVGQRGPVMLPLVTGFCPVPAFGCGGQDVTVRKNGTLALPPGSYGALELQNDAELRLVPGTYEICSLRGGRRAIVSMVAGTVLDVQGTLALGNGSRLGTDGSGLPVVNVLGSEVKFGAASRVLAGLSAPAAKLELGRGVQWRGSFCAREVTGGRRVKLDCVAEPPTTTTTTAAPTTTTTASTTTTTAPTTTTTASTATAPTTTTTTTTVPTTTTTTVPQPLTCGSSNFLDVTAALVYEPRIVGGVFGMFLEVDYPASVGIPGSGTASTARARFTNLIGTSYRFVASDVDSNGDSVDDRGRTLVTANTTEPIPSAAIERVRFDCPSGTVVQPSQFTCRPTGLSDSAGQLFPPDVAALVSCALLFATP